MTKRTVFFSIAMLLPCASCTPTSHYEPNLSKRLIPAEEFSRSIEDGTTKDFSIFRVANKTQPDDRARLDRASMSAPVPAPAAVPAPAVEAYAGDPRYLDHGLQLKRSLAAPARMAAPSQMRAQMRAPVTTPPAELPPGHPLNTESALDRIPPGSRAPYYQGQMTSNPSLWPDEAQNASLFRDFRAFQPMDVISIKISESNQGKKKADTTAEASFDILAGITKFFGLETKEWVANNPALDPANMIVANSTSKFEGEGETNRSGTLSGNISAVIMEILPNGVLRIEGTKIIAVNDEEEVMVISGLVRQRDIDAANTVVSSKIANMRIDFYGQGVVADQQAPGWAAQILSKIWPF
ncbi:MAG: flagellar basal body L-ring protein FlgH [Bdellovibrionales bacterium]|nr:flagellar basal body L-ring protein FlgH [Bdellovibrionales bacterium]